MDELRCHGWAYLYLFVLAALCACSEMGSTGAIVRVDGSLEPPDSDKALDLAEPDARITAVRPACGPPEGGTPISIQGAYFARGVESSLTIDGVPAITPRWVSASELQAITPLRPGRFGAVAVAVQSADGRRTVNPSVFAYCRQRLEFADTREITTAHAVIQQALADLNGDGKLDLITAGAESSDPQHGGDTAAVLLGTGDGDFSPISKYQLQDIARDQQSLAIADMTGDGRADLVVRGSTGGIYILAGNGDGTFGEPAVTVMGGTYFRTMLVGDYDADGKLDLAVSPDGGGVEVLRNQGDGTFISSSASAILAGAPFLANGDFNKDGQLDLAVTSFSDLYPRGSGMRVLLGRGDGTFAIAWTEDTLGPRVIVVGDFNGDGNQDLVTGPYHDNIGAFYAGRGDGTFQRRMELSGFLPTAMVAQDLNNDGKLDLVVKDGGSVTTLLGNGDGSFGPPTSHQQPDLSSFVDALATGDVDDDGKPDVIAVQSSSLASRHSVALFRGRGDGTYYSPALLPSRTRWNSSMPGLIAAADLDGDGLTDLVRFVHEARGGPDFLKGSIEILRNQGQGQFAPAVAYEVGKRPRAIAVADWNHDNRPDVAVVNEESGTISILLNKGHGTFAAATQYDVDQGPFSLAACDYNGDGKLDLAVLHASAKSVVLLRGRGDGTLVHSERLLLGGMAADIASGDFNSDGRSDLAVTMLSGALDILLSNGSGFASQTIFFEQNRYPHSLATADLNRDGHPDLIFSSSTDLGVLLGRPDGSFAVHGFYRSALDSAVEDPSRGYWDMAVTDLDGDGLLDVAVTIEQGIRFFRGQGTGSLLPQSAYGGLRVGLAAADVNGDGQPDLVGSDFVALSTAYD